MEDFSILTIKLLFLLLPGIIYRLLYERWQFRPKRHFNVFIIYSFIGSVVFYGLYYLIFVKLFHMYKQVFFMNNLLNVDDLSLHYIEIFWTVVIAIFSVYVVSWEKNHKYLYMLLTKWKFIKESLEFFKPTFVEPTIGVWDCVFDNCGDNECWIKVYNIQKDVVYAGWLDKYSESVNEHELFLTDVEVLSAKGKLIRKVPALYLSQKTDNIVIEFMKYGEEEVCEEKRSTNTKGKENRSIR